jgi:hypothetical protein
MRARNNKHTAIADLLDKAAAKTKKGGTGGGTAPRPVPAAVPAEKKQAPAAAGTAATKPPPPGKAPSDAFLRQMVTRYYQMGVNGTLTAPLRVDVQIHSLIRKPMVKNKVSLLGGRVYRVNDAAPANAPLYPITVRVTTTEHYNSGPTQKEYHWEFDAFNQQAGMISTGGWILSSKGPYRGGK